MYLLCIGGAAMFGKSKDKVNNIYNFSEAVEGRKFPLLILDEKWLELFPEEEMSDRIKELCTKLRKAMAKEGKINTDVKAYKRYKSQLMQEIVENMEVDDTKLGMLKAKKLEKNQKLINELKEKISNAEGELADMPFELNEINRELMIESSNECYKKMIANGKDIKELETEIAGLQRELAEKTAIKQAKESENNVIYSYMHNIYGAGIMEKLDSMVQKVQDDEQ